MDFSCGSRIKADSADRRSSEIRITHLMAAICLAAVVIPVLIFNFLTDEEDSSFWWWWGGSNFQFCGHRFWNLKGNIFKEHLILTDDSRILKFLMSLLTFHGHRVIFTGSIRACPLLLPGYYWTNRSCNQSYP